MAIGNLLSRSKIYIFLLAPLIVAGCDSSEGATGSATERSALLVSVAPAEPAAEYTVRREFTGRVEATRESRVGFELGGELLAVTVDEGAFVAAGTSLARLDTDRLEARLAEAEAALEQALSARDLAARTLERNRVAAEFDGISEQELDLAIDAANAARAGAAAARARVNSVEVDIEKSRLQAPYDAIVIGRLVDEGQIVSAGQPVLHLQEAAAPEVRIGVSGDLAASIEAGQRRLLEIGSREVTAEVRAVLPVRDPSTRTVDVILRMDEAASALPGDLARLAIEETLRAEGYWLPLGALTEGNRGLWTVYVATPLADGPLGSVGATHALEARAVEIVHEDTAHVFVRGALLEGDRYVTGGLHRIVPNQLVRIRPDVSGSLALRTNGS